MKQNVSPVQAALALSLTGALVAGGYRFALQKPTMERRAPAPRNELRLAALFSDNMVLQQKAPIRVWGWAPDGEKVTVTFEGETGTAVTEKGKWSVTLPPSSRPAGGPYTLTVAGKKQLTFKNVLLGEVWVCGGQSNMQYALKYAADAERQMAAATNPNLRFFRVHKDQSDRLKSDVKSDGKGWEVASPKSAAYFSAVGYFFGRDLQKARNVPIGLIHDCVGGTPAESWIPEDRITANPVLKPVLAEFPPAMQKYEREMVAYKPIADKAKADHQPVPKAPRHPNRYSENYNAMIAPVLDYPVAGVLWYQGESNIGNAERYKTALPTLIESWRQGWQNPKLPFLIVELPPLHDPAPDPNATARTAELREAQAYTTDHVANTGLVVLTDTGEKDLHPKNKEVVGARLAKLAEKLVYGAKAPVTTPTFHGFEVKGNRALVQFDHVGDGLTARATDNQGKPVPAGKVVGFSVAGVDGKFYWAESQIVGSNTVVVSAAAVPNPVAVHYGFADFPVVNLASKNGWPARPFRAATATVQVANASH